MIKLDFRFTSIAYPLVHLRYCFTLFKIIDEFHDYPKKQSPLFSRPMKSLLPLSEQVHPLQFTVMTVPSFQKWNRIQVSSTVIKQCKKSDLFRSNYRVLKMFIRTFFGPQWASAVPNARLACLKNSYDKYVFPICL